MTQDEIKTKLLNCLDIDPEDYDDEGTLSSFAGDDEEEDLEHFKTSIEDTFDIDVEQITLDLKISEMLTVLYEHFGVA